MKKSLSVLGLLMVTATALMAHPGHDLLGLSEGLEHLFANWDHLLALIAIVALVSVAVVLRRRRDRRDDA